MHSSNWMSSLTAWVVVQRTKILQSHTLGNLEKNALNCIKESKSFDAHIHEKDWIGDHYNDSNKTTKIVHLEAWAA